MDFDDVLSEVGDYGTYQKLVLWFLLLPATFPCGFHAYNQLFMASVPDHWCQMPEGIRTNYPNASEEVLRKISIPFNNETNTFSRCSRYDLNFETFFSEFLAEDFVENSDKISYLQSVHESAIVVPCDQGWHYELGLFSTSIVADWDLVCDKAFMPTLALVLFGASGLIGTYIFGHIQDGLGRRPAFFLYLTILCLFGVATAFAPSFNWWLGCRIGVGFTVPAIMCTPFVLALEIVGPTQRSYATVMMNAAYSFALIVLAAIVYVVRIWPQLALATTIPFLGFFGFYWVLPESPRWLLVKGRVNDAYNILSTMARVNKRPLRSDFLSCLKKQRNEQLRTYGNWDLFKTSNLCKKTIVLTFIWFTNTSVYVGLSYYAPALGGDAYLNFFLAGVSELPTYIFLWPSMEYWGRRWTLCFSMIIGGAACIATVLSQDDQKATLALYCIGKFGISSSFVVLPLVASELYPTVVRGVGIGFSSTAGMIGPIVIPLVNYLGAEMMVLPLIIMGATLILGGASSLLLPETLHQPLPQSLEDGETFGSDMTLVDYCDCCPRRRLKRKTRDTPALDLNTTNDQSEPTNSETDVLHPLPEDDFYEGSYSSLRRNSFKKAQSESVAIPLSEKLLKTRENTTNGKAYKFTKKKPEKLLEKRSHRDVPISAKVTVI